MHGTRIGPVFIVLLSFLMAAMACPAHAQAQPPTLLPAASFNCATAPGTDEHVICADPTLRQADHDLATAYKAARAASTSPDHRAALRSDERSWIIQRNAECRITKYTVLTTDNLPRLTDCFLNEYQERLADLAQMQRHPSQSPQAISHPIRPTFTSPSPATNIQFATTGPIPGTITALAWRTDTSLLILTTTTANTATLYTSTPPGLKLIAQIPQPLPLSTICPVPNIGTILTNPNASTISFIGPTNQIIATTTPASLPASIRNTCNLNPTTLTAATLSTVIQAGPRTTGLAPNPRFVTLTTPTGPITTPIRIDSRFNLAVTYQPLANQFIISPTQIDSSQQRQWQKQNCLTFWSVSAQTGQANPTCIPFGPYASAIPVPLPTASGLYIYAPGFGIYTVNNGKASLYLPGGFSPPALSPNGCKLAIFPPPKITISNGMQIISPPTGAIIVTLCKNPT